MNKVTLAFTAMLSVMSMGALAQKADQDKALSGSEQLRAERCAGLYECYEDGWQNAPECAAQRIRSSEVPDENSRANARDYSQFTKEADR